MHSRFLPLGLLSVVLVSCGGDAITSVSQPPVVDLAARAISMMAEVGCRQADSKGGDRDVTIGLPDGGSVTVDCTGIGDDNIRAGVSAFNRTFIPVEDEEGAQFPHAETAPAKTYYTCEVETTWTFFPNVGVYVVTSRNINWCITWQVYGEGPELGEWEGGSGVEPPDEEIILPLPDSTDFDEEKLNAAEIGMCIAHAVQCVGYRNMAIHALFKADSIARALSGPNARAHNNQYDAWRHAYWSALLVRAFAQDSSAARDWTDAHETSSLSSTETCMDQHNNAIGRLIGIAMPPGGYSSAQVWSAVLSRSDLQNFPQC